jgi:cytochrome c oxidase assembly factor CtaG
VVNWNWEPSVPLGTAALAVGYALAIGRRRSRFPDSGPVGRGRIFAFLAGLSTLLIALASPLDLLSDRYL